MLKADPASGPARGWPDDLLRCYRENSSALTGYVLGLVGDVGLAQDISQEAFIELFGRWRHVKHPRAYVYLAATNRARMHWRRRDRERGAVSALARSAVVQHDEYDPWLWDLVRRLPTRLRVPVLLHYYADLPIAEVAAQLNLPLGTAKRRLHEARGLLHQAVEATHA